MAGGIFDFAALLDPKQLFALPFVREGVRLELPTNQMLGIFRSLGFKMSNERFADLVKYARADEDSGSYFRSLAAGESIDDSFMPQAITRLTRKYSFVVEMEGYDPFDTAVVKRYITISTDELLEPNEILQEAYNNQLRDNPTHAIMVVSAQIVSGIRAGSLGTL